MRRLLLLGSALALITPLALAQGTPPSAPSSAGRIDDALEITSIRVLAGHPDYGLPRQRITLGKSAPAISAIFFAKGSGQVNGHWELAMPADGAPTTTDLTPTPSLSASARLNQRRFKRLDSFSFSLSPGERHVIHGPTIDAQTLSQIGRYHVILRIDSISSISSAAPVLPSQVAAAIIEIEN
ncbi:MAG: hypothetical protein RLY82_1687 [Pseudomonadota bacterium]|jgi:hypothetical protein